MTDLDLKQIRNAIKEEVNLVVEGRVSEIVEEKVSKVVEGRVSEIVEEKVSKVVEGRVSEIVAINIKAALDPVNKKLDALWDQTVAITEEFAEIKESINSHDHLHNTHTENFRRHDKRLQTVENLSGIVPPTELTLTR